MTQADMSPFMGEDRSVMFFVVAAVHHNIAHPTERCQCCVTGHADNSTVRLRMTFASSYQQHHFQYRCQCMAQRYHYTYYKYNG